MVSNFIENHAYYKEHPRAALVNKEGVVRVSGDDEHELPAPVVIVVTNARVLFIAPDGDLELEEVSADYGAIVDIDTDADEPNLLEVTTTDGTVWRAMLPNANPDVVDAVKNHLQWVGDLRSRTVEFDENIDAVGDKIREYAAEMDWEAARAVYQRSRDALDRHICDVQLTTTTADHVLAPELTDIERALEEAHVRLYIEQSRSKLELATHLVEREDYDSAAAVLQETRDLYQSARDQSEALQRGDAFQFGRQRELQNDLDRLEWEIESTAAEPVRQARDAAVRAEEADDLATAIESWEAALDRYGRILGLDWPATDQELPDDEDAIREKRTEAAQRLVHLHAELARKRWNQAVYRQRAGDGAPAIERCATAVTHLERAEELTDEFDHEDINLADHLAWLTEAVPGARDRSPGQRVRDPAMTGQPRSPPEDSPWESEDNATQPSDIVPPGDATETDDTDGGENDSEAANEATETDEAPTLEGQIPTIDEESGAADRESGVNGADGATVGDESTADGDAPVEDLDLSDAGDATTEEWSVPSVDALNEIDTHHDITLDLEEVDAPGDVPSVEAADGGESTDDAESADTDSE